MTRTMDVRKALAELGREFSTSLENRFDTIETHWTLATKDPACLDRQALTETHHHVHKLAGAASSFGFREVGSIALIMDRVLRELIESNDEPPSLVSEVSALLEELLQFPTEDPEPEAARHAIEATVQKPAALAFGGERTIYVVEDDTSLGRAIEKQLTSYGYEIRVFNDTLGVIEACRQHRPGMLIVDVMLPEGNLAGTDLLKDLRQHALIDDVPVIFISRRADLEARLAAVRSGGCEYLVKPVDLLQLEERLRGHFSEEPASPYRVLVVDDDETLAHHHCLVLKAAGMECDFASGPRDALQRLEVDLPDLVLMDVLMPEVSGPELVQVLRQFDRYQSLPIVYLSTESDLDRQLAALELGADDFLTKPISNRQLVAAVRSRVQRARVLERLMNHDRLTGLLSHVVLKDRLAAEISRAGRTEQPLSFALLDLDHFKSVNDRWGHLLGDRVLRSLAQLLTFRLRKIDSAGRYGGEEFGIILPHCAEKDAYDLIDDLRQRFGAVAFSTSEQSFHCTFSAGLTQARSDDHVDDVIERADSALYCAKEEGRNRVFLESLEGP